MRNFVILLSFFTLYLTPKLSAQDHISAKLIPALSQYRSELLKKDPDDLATLNDLLIKWKELEPDHEERISFLFQIQYASQVIGLESSYIKKFYPLVVDSSMLASISERELDILAQNAQLVSLIIEGFIQPEFPFKLQKNEDLLRELHFYKLDHGQTVADIGTGQGNFGLILSMTGLDLDLALNEIDEALIEILKLKKEHIFSNYRNARVNIVKGTKSKSGLGTKKYDRIILRLAFHHFSRKKAMLRSIRNNLGKNGMLFLKESTTDRFSTGCRKRLTEEKILELLKQEGFELRDRMELEESTLFAFSIPGRP